MSCRVKLCGIVGPPETALDTPAIIKTSRSREKEGKMHTFVWKGLQSHF